MHSLRKWFYRPKKEDSSKLALFYWADEELTMVAAELDSFDGRTDPDRCSILVSQLRMCQDKVLSICNDIMDDAIPDMRANRDFRAKFPDDVLHENLAGQLWFGAECLAAGSNIIHRELESASMRPLAKALTRSLNNVRCLLREQSLKNSTSYSEKVREALRIFDRLFAEFELCYVGAMVPIKSAKEYHLQQEIVVLFSETLIRVLQLSLVTQEMIDDYDPSLMFTIPRLAIVWGLLLYPDGPFNVERESADLSELFRPFCNLLFKIRDLLWTLTESELHTLEKMLCSQDEPKIDEKSTVAQVIPADAVGSGYINKSSQKHLNCKQFIHDFYAYNFGVPSTESNLPEHVNKCLKEDTRSNDSKHSKRSRNGALQFGMEFKPGTELQGNYKAADALESEISDLVPNQDSNQSAANADNELNDSECNLSDECFRTNLENSDDHQHGGMARCHNGSKHITPEHYSYRRFNDEVETEHASSLESHLSRFQEKCSCGTHLSSREHLTPSRELMQQVMRQVEIVPQGQPITGYSSSPDNSPRAYHHGLLSQSFPIHSEHGNPSDSSASDVPRRRLKDGRRPTRGRYARRRLPPLDCDTLSTQCYYSSNQAHSRQDGDVGSQWNLNPAYSSPLTIPRLPRVEDLSGASEATYSSCSSCQSVSSVSSAEWDSTSPDTSSYNSECQDDEEIALALQAAEIASRNKARSRFKNSGDLLHKLFVCISGVADQLQTNYASDLRNILKSVFDMNCTQSPLQESCDNSLQENSDNPNNVPVRNSYNGFSQPQLSISDPPLFNNNSLRDDEDDDDRDHSSVDSAEEVVADGTLTPSLVISELEAENEIVRTDRELNSGPPEWIPDELSSQCMACKLQFTILRRRHHCRNCGKIFCSRCSSNTIPLPRFGHLKPVRVCNQCFMYQLTNLVMQRQL